MSEFSLPWTGVRPCFAIAADATSQVLPATSGTDSFEPGPEPNHQPAPPAMSNRGTPNIRRRVRQFVFGLVGPDGVPLVQLPVGPVPAYLAYELFARPLVERLAGREVSEPELVDGELTITVESDISTAPTAGDNNIPEPYSTPAASGIATTL